MWVRVDDTFYDHPRIIRVALAAQGLYWQGVSYCARHLTDGVVPKEFVGRRRKLADQLVKHKLWEKTPSGDYKIRHFLEWNPSAAEIKRKRKSDLERKRNPGGIRKDSAGNPSVPSHALPIKEKELDLRSLAAPNSIDLQTLVKPIPSVSLVELQAEETRMYGRRLAREERQ